MNIMPVLENRVLQAEESDLGYGHGHNG